MHVVPVSSIPSILSLCAEYRVRFELPETGGDTLDLRIREPLDDGQWAALRSALLRLGFLRLPEENLARAPYKPGERRRAKPTLHDAGTDRLLADIAKVPEASPLVQAELARLERQIKRAEDKAGELERRLGDDGSPSQLEGGARP